MPKFHDSELSREIDNAIVQHLEAGEPTADEVSQHVISRHQDLIRKYGFDLALSQVRNIVSSRMKKVLASKGHGQQLKLIRFAGEEPDSALTFRDAAGEIRYVATARATEAHHRGYLVLLREQIKADNERLVAAETFFHWLKPVFRRHPGITTAEAVQILDSTTPQGLNP